MDVPVRAAGQLGLEFWRIVRGVVVHHQIHARHFRHCSVDFLRHSLLFWHGRQGVTQSLGAPLEV